MKETLYDLLGKYKQVYELLTDEEVDPQTVEDTLEGLLGEIEIKASGYVKLLNRLDMELDACKKQKDLWTAGYNRRKRGIEKLKNYVVSTMITMDVDEINAEEATFKLAGNGGQQPLEIDEDNVPYNYMKVIYEIDREKIRKDLESGKELSFARFLPRGKHLKIKY